MGRDVNPGKLFAMEEFTYIEFMVSVSRQITIKDTLKKMKEDKA
jgi:hypothetical protein